MVAIVEPRRRWARVELCTVDVAMRQATTATVAGIRSIARQLGIGRHPLEEVWVAAADGRCIRDVCLVGRGQHQQVEVSIPAVLTVPLLAGTDRFFLIHTHPAGSTVPSGHDLELTRSVIEAANTCGLTLIDHVIVTGAGEAISLRELGFLE